MISVAAIVQFATQTLPVRLMWPASISERVALETLLCKMSNEQLSELVSVKFNQSPRPGVPRITWMDAPPGGHYYFNQHIYGEGGVQQQVNIGIAQQNFDYNPDIPNLQYQGTLDGPYMQSLAGAAHMPREIQGDILRDAPQYNPSVY